MKIYACKTNEFEDFSGLSLLTKERQERFNRYIKIEAKLHCLLAGLLLRYALGEKVNTIITNEYKKPFLQEENIYFNLSHSGELVLLATDTQKLGIDIEKIKEAPLGVSKKCFTDDELSWLYNKRANEAFYKIWTAKESVMKAFGKGFHMSPRSFSVMPIENGWHEINDSKWFIQWLILEDYIISVSTEKEDNIELVFLSREDLLNSK